MPPVAHQTAQSSSSLDTSTPQEMRITQGGKMERYIAYALKFFEENPDRALILHTLPLKDPTPGKGKEPLAVAPTEPGASRTEPKLPPSTVAIQKLISVAEIIKDQYLSSLEGSLVGLYQYNELGCLEDLEEDSVLADEEDAAARRSETIIDKLSKLNNVQRRRSPYMKITLSRAEIPSLSEKSSRVTAQPPLKRHLSKSAKGRLKKRLKKAAAANQGGEENVSS